MRVIDLINMAVRFSYFGGAEGVVPLVHIFGQFSDILVHFHSHGTVCDKRAIS